MRGGEEFYEINKAGVVWCNTPTSYGLCTRIIYISNGGGGQLD